MVCGGKDLRCGMYVPHVFCATVGRCNKAESMSQSQQSCMSADTAELSPDMKFDKM